MSLYHRLEFRKVGSVAAVRLLDREIRDDGLIQQIGSELFNLVDNENCPNLVISFANVAFLSSAALVKLIAVHKLVNSRGGHLRLCNIRQEIREVFTITHLDRLLDIRADEDAAIREFAPAT
jgi:anti-sigma B factor antagonist